MTLSVNQTLGLYWFTQLELRSVLLYSTVNGSTNQNLITKQVIRPATPWFTSIPNTTYDTFLDSSLIWETQVLFNTKPLLAFTNSSSIEYKYSITLKEWINNKAQIQNDFA